MGKFELTAGFGTIFKNTKKANPKHPDFTGKLRTLDGEMWDISAWAIKREGRDTFLSLAIKPEWKASGGTDMINDMQNQKTGFTTKNNKPQPQKQQPPQDDDDGMPY